MPIDIIFMAIFAYGFWQGYSRGIIGTIFNLAAYVFGFTLAFKITPTTTTILERLFHSENPSMFLAAFVVNLVFIMFIIRQAGRSMEGAFRALYLGVINQVLGGVLLGGFAVLIYSILLWFLVKVQFINDTTIAESRSYPFLKDLPATAKATAVRFQPLAEDFWGTSITWMDRIQKYGVQKTETKPKMYDIPDGGARIEGVPERSAPQTTSRPSSSSSSADDNGIEQ